jgi:hypothetical protein
MARIVATSDADAFQRVLERFEHDVGTIIALCGDCENRGFNPGSAPYWALLRMMFPVAESLADLIYPPGRTSIRLIKLLENEFQAVRTGYKGKAATIAQLFRHSLTHADEPRVLITPNQKRAGWLLSYLGPDVHLQLVYSLTQSPVVCFDAGAFYDDIVAVCRAAIAKSWSGDAMQRYNEWPEYTLCQLQAGRVPRAEQLAAQEIDGGFI